MGQPSSAAEETIEMLTSLQHAAEHDDQNLVCKVPSLIVAVTIEY